MTSGLARVRRETEIKRLSEAEELSKYCIIHFATHGALAGQVSGNSEPGLLLTPPDTATETTGAWRKSTTMMCSCQPLLV
jgi:CHAT domain-containing protein